MDDIFEAALYTRQPSVVYLYEASNAIINDHDRPGMQNIQYVPPGNRQSSKRQKNIHTMSQGRINASKEQDAHLTATARIMSKLRKPFSTTRASTLAERLLLAGEGGGGRRGMGGSATVVSAPVSHLNRREGHHALGEAGELRVTPSKRPPCLSAHARHGLHRVEKMSLLCWVFHVSVDKQAVHLAVYVLDRDLEAVEATGLRELDLAAEVACQILFFFGGGEQEGEGKVFSFFR